jgi:hypothetical protein
MVFLTIMFLTGFGPINTVFDKVWFLSWIPATPWIVDVWDVIWTRPIPTYILEVGDVFGLISIALLAIRPLAPDFVQVLRFRRGVWTLWNRGHFIELGVLVLVLVGSALVVDYPANVIGATVGFLVFVIRYTYILVPSVLLGSVLEEGSEVTLGEWTKLTLSALVLTTLITGVGAFAMGYAVYVV